MRARTDGHKHVPITGGPDGRIEVPFRDARYYRQLMILFLRRTHEVTIIKSSPPLSDYKEKKRSLCLFQWKETLGKLHSSLLQILATQGWKEGFHLSAYSAPLCTAVFHLDVKPVRCGAKSLPRRCSSLAIVPEPQHQASRLR